MGISYDTPMSEYLMIDAFSSSVAFKAVTQSPLHALYSSIAPQDYSSAADKGTIAHKILLEGSEDGVVLVPADDWRTKAAQKMRGDARVEGKIAILDKEIGSIRAMVTSAQRYVERTEIAGVLGTGNPEVTVTWDEDGVPCKIRPDYLTADWHISVKTTAASADPITYSKRMLGNEGHDFGLMFYKRGLLKNEINVEHRLLVIEQKPPYGCCLVALEPMKEAMCESMVEQSISLWRKCLETQNFSGYSVRTHWAEPTPWELAEAELRGLNYLIGEPVTR